MADEAEDVLELDTDLELDVPEDDEAEQTSGQAEDEDGETDFTFADEEGAAPVPEQETSVIRELRKANREMARKLAEVQRNNQPKPIEVGPKPTLADCNFDEEEFEAKLDEWKDRDAQAKRAEQEAVERQQAVAKEWEQRAETFEASKAASKIPGIDAAEETVKSALSDSHFAILMLAPEDAPKLIAALAKSPAKLEELSKLDLARAAMMVGELKGKVQMTTRKAPAPDVPLRGSAAFSGGTDKQLAKLEQEAERTGDRTKLIQYRRQLRDRAA